MKKHIVLAASIMAVISIIMIWAADADHLAVAASGQFIGCCIIIGFWISSHDLEQIN